MAERTDVRDVAIVGPNSSLQVSLAFEQLEFGAVNRATSRREYVGGKGTHAAIAANTIRRGSSVLLHCLGAATGLQVEQILDELGVPQVICRIAGRTRICTTLLPAGDEMTELVEPSPVLSGAESEVFLRESQGVLAGKRGVALCGTLPAGLPEDTYAQIAAGAPRDALVLLDGYKGVKPVLDTGRVDVLKVNASELRALSGEDALEQAAQVVRDRFGVGVIGVTDGPANAWLFGQDQVWRYEIPTIQAVNPIGAGDTVTGVTLQYLVGGSDPQLAFCYGLAAATASCQSGLGAAFTLTEMEQIAQRIEVRAA